MSNWVNKEWVGFRPKQGNYIWHDNDGHTYYSNAKTEYKDTSVVYSSGEQYELVDGQWIEKDWGSAYIWGNGVWQDNDGHIYCTMRSSTDSLNLSYELINGQWVYKPWNRQGYSGQSLYIYGPYIWHDNTGHTYLSYGTNAQYELVNGEWADKNWNINGLYGEYVWNYNGHTYYSNGAYAQYELVNGEWVDKNWNVMDISAVHIWSSNGHIYHSVRDNRQYELVDGQWIEKDWGETYPVYGSGVWKDNTGQLYYSYSNGTVQLIYDGSEPEPEPTYTFSIEPYSIDTDSEFGAYYININTNHPGNHTYRIMDDKNALIREIWKITGGLQYRVFVNENTSTKARTADIMFYIEDDGKYNASLHITQEGLNPEPEPEEYFNVSPETLHFDKYGNTATVHIDTNISGNLTWTIATGTDFTEITNTGQDTVSITVPQNPGKNARTCTVMFYIQGYGQKNATVYIEQEGGSEPEPEEKYVKIIPDTLHVWSGGNRYNTTIECDTPYLIDNLLSCKILTGEDFITIYDAPKYYRRMMISVAENPSLLERRGTIKVYYTTDESVYDILTVIQSGKEVESDLTFSGNLPVILNYDGSADNIYAPVRSSSCDVNIVSTKILDDLYTAKKDEVCVKIERNIGGHSVVETLWEGYMTPNVYTQNITQNLDNISMTAIDPVSLLKYITIDKIMNRPNVIKYSDLIASALSYVMLESDKLWIEDTVTYNDDSFLNLSIQVSNFWDEAGEPSDLYSILEEMLRIFCLTLVFDGTKFIIYNTNNTSDLRHFSVYTIYDDGTLWEENRTTKSSAIPDWISNNVEVASMEINQTYDKITGVASTSNPMYSTMAFDKVDYNERDKYDVGFLNIQRNKAKGGLIKKGKSDKTIEAETKDYWFYLWNGVYTDSDYNLTSHSGDVNGWLNIHGAWNYLNNWSTESADYGSILNFYGGIANPTGTGKEQTQERSSEIKKRITAYAPDNGKPLEFLEDSEVVWKYTGDVFTPALGPFIDKPDGTSQLIFGEGKRGMGGQRVIYRQTYDNMMMIEGHQQTIDINITHSFSRTGIDTPITILNNTRCDNRKFRVLGYDGGSYAHAEFDESDVSYFPSNWNAENIKVEMPFFNRYKQGSGLSEVWEGRRIDLYVVYQDEDGNDVYLQFNGKDWVENTRVSLLNCFYLETLMNGKNLYHNDLKYDLIYFGEEERYALNEDGFTYRTKDGRVVDKEGTEHKFEYYGAEDKEWFRWINKVSEGSLSIKLPDIGAVNAKVVVDIYSSDMLGSTGADSFDFASDNLSHIKYPIYYEVTGIGKYTGGYEREIQPNEVYNYGKLETSEAYSTFIPLNITYVKAEHLDLDITVSVPESNLGKMFSESDIRYTMDKSEGYLEQYEGPTFQVNTKHPLVASSFSYLIYKTTLAEPGEFVFKEEVSARPECYTVQAYMNWLHRIRKIYNKTIRTKNGELTPLNIGTKISSIETDYIPMMIVSDSIDLKTSRHTISAIDSTDLDVDNVEVYSVIEVPRKSRNGLYDLPTSRKKWEY